MMCMPCWALDATVKYVQSVVHFAHYLQAQTRALAAHLRAIALAFLCLPPHRVWCWLALSRYSRLTVSCHARQAAVLCVVPLLLFATGLCRPQIVEFVDLLLVQFDFTGAQAKLQVCATPDSFLTQHYVVLEHMGTVAPHLCTLALCFSVLASRKCPQVQRRAFVSLKSSQFT